MFSPSDFEVPLEKQLKMRLVYDDIDKCTDVKALQDNLESMCRSTDEVSAPTFDHTSETIRERTLKTTGRAEGRN